MPLRILQDHVRGFFGNHDDGRVGVAGYQIRHHRGVDYAEAFDPANPQPLIDDGKRIASHPAGRCRMIDRAAALPAEIQQLRIGRNLGAGIELFDHIAAERRSPQNPSQYLQAFDVGGAIDLGCKIVDPYFSRGAADRPTP